MTNTIRQAINAHTNNEISDDLLLVQAGITSVHGNLTALGRRVLADLAFRDGGKEKLAEAVRNVIAAHEEPTEQ